MVLAHLDYVGTFKRQNPRVPFAGTRGFCRQSGKYLFSRHRLPSVFEIEAFAFGQAEGGDAGDDEGGGEDDEGHGLVAAGQGQEPRHEERRDDGGCRRRCDAPAEAAEAHGRINRPEVLLHRLL